MASVFALRALLGASLGLGALDLVWINVSLAPRLVERGESSSAPAVVMAAPETEPTLALEPEPAGSPEPEREPAPVVVADAPVEPRNERVYFATGSAVLGGKARVLLRELVESAGPEAAFVLEGHADHRGREAFNRHLSRRRAVAVASYFRELGVTTERVRVMFAGEDQPSGEGALWRDRRVDIQIIGGP